MEFSRSAEAPLSHHPIRLPGIQASGSTKQFTVSFANSTPARPSTPFHFLPPFVFFSLSFPSSACSFVILLFLRLPFVCPFNYVLTVFNPHRCRPISSGGSLATEHVDRAAVLDPKANHRRVASRSHNQLALV
jgi:hypothetical protein